MTEDEIEKITESIPSEMEELTEAKQTLYDNTNSQYIDVVRQ